MNRFKAALFLLLIANTAYFAFFETASKGIDACAWLTLLLLFEAESSYAERFASRKKRMLLRLARLAAGAGVIAATIGYVVEDNALDAANSALWIGVVILLELELRLPAVVGRNRRAFNAAAIALYGALAVLVVLWSAARMWVDAYDAVLWLVAFAALELRILRNVRGKAAGPA
jgi:hypothetical protein